VVILVQHLLNILLLLAEAAAVEILLAGLMGAQAAAEAVDIDVLYLANRLAVELQPKVH
jgi:hypothetical protein